MQGCTTYSTYANMLDGEKVSRMCGRRRHDDITIFIIAYLVVVRVNCGFDINCIFIWCICIHIQYLLTRGATLWRSLQVSNTRSNFKSIGIEVSFPRRRNWRKQCHSEMIEFVVYVLNRIDLDIFLELEYNFKSSLYLDQLYHQYTNSD